MSPLSLQLLTLVTESEEGNSEGLTQLPLFHKEAFSWVLGKEEACPFILASGFSSTVPRGVDSQRETYLRWAPGNILKAEHLAGCFSPMLVARARTNALAGSVAQKGQLGACSGMRKAADAHSLWAWQLHSETLAAPSPFLVLGCLSPSACAKSHVLQGGRDGACE